MGTVSPDPLGAGSVSPDPNDAGSVSPKAAGSVSSKDAGFVSPDPLGAGSVLLTPWVRAPSRPTPRARFLSHPMGTYTAANHSRSKRMGLGQNSNTRKETGTPRCNPWP